MKKYDYKNIVSDYDNLVKQYKWQAPEIIYNHLSKFIQKDAKLLDIGVGTGISSERFHKNQVKLYGLDNSPELIAACQSKKIFKEILLFDISKDKIPYPALTFDGVICSGVLHFFSNLEQVFGEITTVLKPKGYFAFTIIDNENDMNDFSTEIIDGINVFHHSDNYIHQLEKAFNFTRFFSQGFTGIKNLKSNTTLNYKLIILKKIIITHNK